MIITIDTGPKRMMLFTQYCVVPIGASSNSGLLAPVKWYSVKSTKAVEPVPVWRRREILVSVLMKWSREILESLHKEVLQKISGPGKVRAHQQKRSQIGSLSIGNLCIIVSCQGYLRKLSYAVINITAPEVFTSSTVLRTANKKAERWGTLLTANANLFFWAFTFHSADGPL